MATACSWIDSPARRVWLWCGAHAFARAALAPLTPVPDAAPLDPLALCLAGVLATASRKQTPLALSLLLAGMVAGDIVAGLPLVSALLRVAGFLALLSIKPKTLSGIWFALWFAVHHATWTAAAPEFLGLFAFPHVYLVTLTQHVLFLAAGSHLLQRGVPPRDKQAWILGLVPLAVMFAAVTLRPSRLWPPPRLGDTWGWTGLLVVLPLVLLPFFPKIIRPRKTASPDAPGKGGESRSPWKDLLG